MKGKTIKAQKVFWYGLLWLNWVVILFFWLTGSHSLLSSGLAGALVALGRLAGLAATYMILQQFFFMGRLPWLERVFGLDNLARWHHTNGNRGLVLLLFHPILLTIGWSSLSGINPWQQLVSFLLDYEHVAWALVGFLLFIAVVGLSVKIVRSRLKYESWYFVHWLAYLAIFVSFGHQVKVGGDLLASRLFYGYWSALYIVIFASHLGFRFVRPVFLYVRHQFRIEQIKRETRDAVSIIITGQKLDQFKIRAGQFMIVRFLVKNLWWQAHPFSLSRLPDGKTLRITIKELGDFTREVKSLVPGAKVFIDGPYGVFTDLFSVSDKVLFIAGGIGITPIRSLFEQMVTKGKNAVLLYANKTPADIVFKNELENLSQEHSASLTYVITEDSDYPGEQGRINKEKLKRLVPDIESREVYLCGPVPMMDALRPVLAELGVPTNRLHYERFAL